MTPSTAQAAVRSIDGTRPNGEDDTARSDGYGFGPTEPEPVSTFPTSKPSELPSAVSKKLWRTPRTVREFASQANQVATMVLNGDLDINTARIYSGIARTVAQAMSTEVSRARFLSELPNLSFIND